MKIIIQQGCAINNKSGFGDYVINGTKIKPRDKSRIEVMSGDMDLGDTISNSGEWKENEYQIILAFRGKPLKKTIKEVLQDFKKYFMIGFAQDEYHFDAVAHYDTNDYHIHIRIPKRNLLTDTALRLYFDAQDRKRVNLIRDTLNLKYNLDTTVNRKPFIEKESIKTNIINKHRLEENRIAVNLNTKKDRAKTIDIINNTVIEYHQSGLIDNFKELQEVISNEFGLNIVKQGYDKPKGFHYLTIESEDKKIRIKGDIYSYEFWNNNRKNRSQQITDDRRDRKESINNREKLNQLEQRLRDTNKKRKKEVNRTYKAARERAKNRNKQDKRKNYNIFRGITICPIDNNHTRSISNNIKSNKTTRNQSITLEDSKKQTGKELLSNTTKRNHNSKKDGLYRDKGMKNDSHRREVETIREREDDSPRAINKRERNELKNAKKSSSFIYTRAEQDAKEILRVTEEFNRKEQTRVTRETKNTDSISNETNIYQEYTNRDKEYYRKLFERIRNKHFNNSNEDDKIIFESKNNNNKQLKNKKIRL